MLQTVLDILENKNQCPELDTDFLPSKPFHISICRILEKIMVLYVKRGGDDE